MAPAIAREEQGRVKLDRLSLTIEADDRKVIEQCQTREGDYKPWTMTIDAHTTPSDEKTPDLSVSIVAEKVMNITISKTFYQLTKKLQESFINAKNLVPLRSSSPWPGTEPLLFLNKTGVPMTVRSSRDLEIVGPELLQTGRYADLRGRNDVSDVETAVEGKDENMSALRQETATHELVLVYKKMLRKVAIGSIKRQIISFNDSEFQRLYKTVLKSSVQSGRRLCTLSSLVKSHLDVDVEILSQSHKSCGIVKPGGSLALPIDVVTTISDFIFRVDGVASLLRKEKKDEHRQLIECGGRRFEAVVKEKPCLPSGAFFTVHLHPPLTLQNLFTVPVRVSNAITINAGKEQTINRCRGESLDLTISYFDEEYTGHWSITDEKFTNIHFKCGKKEMYFGVLVFRGKSGGLRAVLYAPYWIDNNSQLKLICKGTTTIALDAANSVGTMFPFKGRSTKPSQKICIAVENSTFSSKQVMDQIGKQAKFECRDGDRKYELALDIRMCTSGLTRVITVSPYYMVSNCGEWTISVREPNPKTWIKVPAKTSIGLYPTGKTPFLIARYSGRQKESITFPISQNIDTFATIVDESAGVSISVNVSSNSTVVYLSSFIPGAAPIQIVNNTSGEVRVDHTFLEKMHGGEGFIVSFTSIRQRVLLFEESHDRAMRAHGSWESDKVLSELRLEMKRITLSVVDNVKKQELLLAAMTSSDLIWGKTTRTGRFKKFDEKKARLLEEYYCKYRSDPTTFQFVEFDKINYDFDDIDRRGQRKKQKNIDEGS